MTLVVVDEFAHSFPSRNEELLDFSSLGNVELQVNIPYWDQLSRRLILVGFGASAALRLILAR